MRLLCINSECFRGRFCQLLATVTGTITTLSDGLHSGWTAPVFPILRNVSTTPVQISEVHEYWLEHIYFMGQLFGMPLTIYCADKLGRKRTILTSSFLHLITWTLIALTKIVELLYVARFIAGVAAIIAFVTTPMYIGEIADERIRGSLGSCVFLMKLIGILIIYSVAPFVSILASSMIGVTFALIQLLTFSFMPESPYFLLLKGKQADALKSLKRLRFIGNTENELKDISEAVGRQSAQRGRPKDLLIVSSNRKAFIIMLTLYAGQQLSCSSVIFMNLHTILTNAATILSENTAAIIFCVIQLVAASSSTLLADRVGRKILLTSSSLLTSICLLLLAIYFALKNSGIDISRYNWIPVVAVSVYAATFTYGLGLMPTVLTGELFSTNVKAMGMTISDTSFAVFSIIAIVLYQQLGRNYGIHWPFFVYSGCCFLLSLFIIFYIPETKGRTLEEVQLILKGESLPASKKHGNELAENSY